MSIQAMTWVLDHSQASGNARCVLISIANHAHADGTGAWPSVATIAREARCSKSTVRSAVARLVRLGELAFIENGGPANDVTGNRTNLYWLASMPECPGHVPLRGQSVIDQDTIGDRRIGCDRKWVGEHAGTANGGGGAKYAPPPESGHKGGVVQRVGGGVVQRVGGGVVQRVGPEPSSNRPENRPPYECVQNSMVRASEPADTHALPDIADDTPPTPKRRQRTPRINAADWTPSPAILAELEADGVDTTHPTIQAQITRIRAGYGPHGTWKGAGKPWTAGQFDARFRIFAAERWAAVLATPRRREGLAPAGTAQGEGQRAQLAMLLTDPARLLTQVRFDAEIAGRSFADELARTIDAHARTRLPDDPSALWLDITPLTDRERAIARAHEKLVLEAAREGRIVETADGGIEIIDRKAGQAALPGLADTPTASITTQGAPDEHS